VGSDIIRIDRGFGPWCNVCHKSVDSWECEYGLVAGRTIGGSYQAYTGEVIFTVRCHGEVFSVSNFRGVLERSRA
jgi:hypothetical protein